MKTSLQNVLAVHNTDVSTLIHLRQTAEKGLFQQFKAGDVIACHAGYPRKVWAVVQLNNTPDVDNIQQCVDYQKSTDVLTSHLISCEWFKIK